MTFISHEDLPADQKCTFYIKALKVIISHMYINTDRGTKNITTPFAGGNEVKE